MTVPPEAYEHPPHQKEYPPSLIQATPPLSKEDTILLTLRILQTMVDQQALAQPPHAFFEDESPLPLGDMVQNMVHLVVMTMPYRQMLYGSLLRLHPHHPHSLSPDSIDYRLVKGPVAQLFLVLRKIVLLRQNHFNTLFPKEFSQSLKTHFHFVKNMLSLDHWKSLLTVLMPSLVLPSYRYVWAQVSHILESTLCEMKNWLLMSKSGTKTSNTSENTKTATSKRESWKPRKTFLQALSIVKGQLWDTPDGYRMKLLSTLWEAYRDNPSEMTVLEIHDFKMLAWAFFSQFNWEKFHQAVDDAVFFHQLDGIEQFGNFLRKTPAHFVHVATCVGAQEQVNRWVEKDVWYNQPPSPPLSMPPLVPDSRKSSPETISSDSTKDSQTPDSPAWLWSCKALHTRQLSHSKTSEAAYLCPLCGVTYYTASSSQTNCAQCGMYSEQQNCSTKGQISLVSQIVAQRTKGKSWENHKTKLGILSFVTPNYRS
jgi:hypothetical protein